MGELDPLDREMLAYKAKLERGVNNYIEQLEKQVATLQAELARVREERERARTALLEQTGHAMAMADRATLEAERDTLRAANAKLRAACYPIVRQVQRIPEEVVNETLVHLCWPDAIVSVGELRVLRDALARCEKGE